MKKITHFLAMFTLLFLISCSGSNSLSLKVMSFNIRYDNPDDGENNWHQRKNQVYALVNQQSCDLIGFQEVLGNQLTDLHNNLPNYDYVGVGRIDGISEGEHSAIFFKKDRFNVLDKGNFWLSETPDVVGSKGWDGACERIASWARLQDKTTLTEVFFINTHLDHVGKVARKEGVNLLLDQAFKLAKGASIVLTGDFNAEPESDVIQNVVNTEHQNYLADTRLIADEVKGTLWTFHDFNKLPTNKREIIDYIFVSPSSKVKGYEILPMTFNDKLVSDHTPVVAEVVLN